MESVADYMIRPLYPEEIHLLRDFLYEAIFIPEGVEPPSRDVVDLPELRLYVEDFGKKKDDCCLVVEQDGKVVGAVWTRIMKDYGHVDENTPSLSISLYKAYRNRGMGSRLMKEMLNLLENKGYYRVSLSVQKANYAVRMYLKLGFEVIKETEEEFVMVKDLFTRMLGTVGQHSNIGRNFTCRCGSCKAIRWLKPRYKIRPLVEGDISEMQQLFRSTVLNVNLRDYTNEEVMDWASCGDDVAHWKDLLSQNCYIGAFDERDRMAGFSSMNKKGYLHSMFVHKDMQGKGVATQLLEEVEKMAVTYGVTEITSEVSLTARPFFERKGYKVVKSQKCRANKLMLTNFVMRKCIL